MSESGTPEAILRLSPHFFGVRCLVTTASRVWDGTPIRVEDGTTLVLHRRPRGTEDGPRAVRINLSHVEAVEIFMQPDGPEVAE